MKGTSRNFGLPVQVESDVLSDCDRGEPLTRLLARTFAAEHEHPTSFSHVWGIKRSHRDGNYPSPVLLGHRGQLDGAVGENNGFDAHPLLRGFGRAGRHFVFFFPGMV